MVGAQQLALRNNEQQGYGQADYHDRRGHKRVHARVRTIEAIYAPGHFEANRWSSPETTGPIISFHTANNEYRKVMTIQGHANGTTTAARYLRVG